MALLLLCNNYCYAQEENATEYQAKKYIDLNIRSVQKLNERVTKQQKRLLNKIKKQETRYLSRLKRKDSVAYAKLSQNPLSYDSISRINKNDSTSKRRKFARTPNALIDSLQGVNNYIADKIHLEGGASTINNPLSGYDNQLAAIKTDANYNNYINSLITQRTNNLKTVSTGSKVKGFKGIDKNVFYAKEKMKVFKQISDEPSKGEELALEYLQGQKGFENYLQKATGNDNSALQGKSSADLQQMGYQTKQQISGQLQKKFGSANMSGLQQNMSKQISQYQGDINKVKSTKNNLKQTKQSAQQLKHIDKPGFKINPMRGLPFSKRIQQQYNWQTTRATLDGKPAMFQFSAMAGFKHTPRLTYGLGLATSIGLGQNWNNIRFSFQGIGVRTFAEWKWIYGIGAYAGYERMYKHEAFTKAKEALPKNELNKHNKTNYNESVLIGLTKSYKVNDKWNGSIQLLYDIWWQDKGLRSPVVLRFTTMKN